MNTTFLTIRAAFIVLCGTLLFFACKKENTEQSNTAYTAAFFTNTTTNQEVQNFITNIQAINAKQEFVTKLASEYGLPKWEYTDTFTSPEGITVIAPLVRPDEQDVAAVLIGVYNDGKLHLNVMPKEDVATLTTSTSQKAGKNEYSALFYKFNRLLFSYGPKAKDTVVKNGKKVLFSESQDNIKISGLRDSYVCTAWYQWQYDSWVYLDTTCEVAYGWQSDGTYNLPYIPGESIPQNPPTGGGGATGGGTNNDAYSQLEIKEDSLQAKYPCAIKLVIDKLQQIYAYRNMVNPFMTKGIVPHLNWNASTQAWGIGQQTSLGFTSTAGSATGMSSTIYLNTELLDKGSKLMIASAAIHETWHAYNNFYFYSDLRTDLYQQSNENWMVATYLGYYLDPLNNTSPNAVQHSTFMANQFDTMVSILATFDGNSRNYNDYRMAMLFGLNNPGPNASASAVTAVTTLYNDLLAKYGITASALDTFWSNQLFSASSSTKLSKTCN